MTTTINTAEHTATAGCPCRLPLLAQAELDDWDSAIAALDAALADAAAARRDLADADREADLLEARALLSITGSNESMRKAALAVALIESITYQDITAEVRALRERLTDAERRQPSCGNAAGCIGRPWQWRSGRTGRSGSDGLYCLRHAHSRI